MMRIGTLFLATLSLTAISLNGTNAQEITGQPGSPGATTTIDGHIPEPIAAFGGRSASTPRTPNHTGRHRSFPPKVLPMSC